MNTSKSLMVLLLIWILSIFLCTADRMSIPDDLYHQFVQKLKTLFEERSLKGFQIEITKNGIPFFYQNFGTKNQKNQLINSKTIFRIASLSKSFSAVAIMQLVQRGKLKLNDSISSLLGYNVTNPYYPNNKITVQMLLCHQSSIAQTQQQYNNFLTVTYNAIDGYSVPSLRQILVPGGKYYNQKMFINNRPGEYHHYSNLNYVIIGTIIQKVSNQRFDVYQQENILNLLNKGEANNATYNPANIGYSKNLGTLYIGNEGIWVPSYDNYNDSIIPSKNLTGYEIGKNGAIFGPQGGLRASVWHLNDHIYMLAHGGVTQYGTRILSQQSANQIIKPRYQYHGKVGGQQVDDHLYGFGIATTSFFTKNKVIEHEVVRGHTGSAYGLISAYFYWKNYCFSYIINGALYGYKFEKDAQYPYERIFIHNAVDEFIQKTQPFSQNQFNILINLAKKKAEANQIEEQVKQIQEA